MSSEAQDAQERVHRAVRGFVGDVDRRFMRPMELKTHLCAADCCRDTEASTERVQACVEKCQSETLRAQNYMQAEMQRFQVGHDSRGYLRSIFLAFILRNCTCSYPPTLHYMYM